MNVTLPPGPQENLLFGSFTNMAAEQLDFFCELGRHGDMSTFRIGRKRFYFVNHPELIRHILTSPNFVRTALSRDLMGSILGRGLLSQEGETHRQQRRLMQPAFHPKRIDSYATTMTALTERMLDTWSEGEERDLPQEMMRLTFAIVSKTLFDADTGEQSRKVNDAFNVLMRAVDREYPLYTVLPSWIPVRRWGLKSRRAVQALRSITQSLIQERRASGTDRGDLLSMLLLAQDEDGTRMTDEQVHAQTLTLLFAGHETTANTLSWAFYLLSEHPEIREKLHAEVDTVLGERPPRLQDLKALPYTEAVLKETLRLYPAAWYAERAPLTDTELGGYPLPAHASVVISVYVTHRDARFFAEPLRFTPERFLGLEDRQFPAYLPFGFGAHQCIGNRFALMEAQLLIASIAQRFTLERAPGTQVKPRPLITLGVEGLNMRVRRRRRLAA